MNRSIVWQMAVLLILGVCAGMAPLMNGPAIVKLERASPPLSPSPPAEPANNTPRVAAIATDRIDYTTSDSIIVSFSGLPGDRMDRITVVPVSSTSQSHVFGWYTSGRSKGQITIPPQKAGDHEVRLLLRSPNGSEEVHARQRITVRPAKTEPVAQAAQDATVTLQTERQVYSADDAITVHYSGMPGNKTDWITIVPAGSAATAFTSWTFTNGAKTGSYTIPRQKAGHYEIRAFFDYPDGGSVIRAKIAVIVEGTATKPAGNESTSKSASATTAANPQGDGSSATLTVDRDSYGAGESMTVSFSGLPGNRTDWITIVPADAPDSTYTFWKLTEGRIDGQITVPGQQPGKYEIRLFFDWPNGKYIIRDRVFVTVRSD